MFNHIMIGSNDIERSKRFYDAVQPLINNLRSDLRTQLGFEPIPTSLELPASGQAEPRGLTVTRVAEAEAWAAQLVPVGWARG